MNIKITWIPLLIMLTLFASCGKSKKSKSQTIKKGDIATVIPKERRVIPKYAKGFKVAYNDNYTLVTVKDPNNERNTEYHYVLIPKGATTPKLEGDYTIIETPVKSVICMTTLQLSNFIKLDLTKHVCGISSTNYLFNKEVKAQIENGTTKRIGIEGNFDAELVLALNPDLILVSPFKRGGFDAIRDLNIPLVSFLGYKENSPLGQAEWIKFTGMLFGIEEKANKMFDEIERRYNDLKSLVENVSNRPKILSGEMRSGNWYVVGGKSFLAQQIWDAGGCYFLSNDERTGGFNLDFETVYSLGSHADFWRLLVSHTGDYSYDVLKANDTRYTDFKAFKEHGVVYCNLRQTPFYEKAPVEPEIVLADLIKVFHPSLLPDYEPVYYKRLMQ